MAGLVDFRLLDAGRNLPGVVLLGAIGVCAAVALALPFIQRSPADDAGGARTAEMQPIETLPQPPDGAQLAALILEQPIFFDDRRLPARGTEEAATDEPPADDGTVPALDAALTGIIVTPEAKLAIVRFKNERQARIMREGTSLDGELAAWRVAEVTPRGIQFTAADGQETALELETHTTSLSAPAAPRSPPRPAAAQSAAPNAGPAAGPAAGGDQASLADEVRRRIAERRAQLRAQRAAQQAQEKADDEQQ